MAKWLVKTEPSEYGWDDLVRDTRTDWTGVSNALAQKHLRQFAPGDEVLIYHTGTQKAVVGIARVASPPFADPTDATGKAVAVQLLPLRALSGPITLASIKSDPSMKDWELVRMARLSVMPVPPAIWTRLTGGK